MTKRINEIKQQLIDDIKQTAEQRGLAQKDLCEKFRVTYPRMSRLYAGHVDEFSLNLLIDYVYKMGRRVKVEVTK
jgi:predicted XRE-type DNA-binding protein